MQILKYEKIEATFKPWNKRYLEVAKHLIDFISTKDFEVIHIGSTSFMVGGKGIIDLSILYQNKNLDRAVNYIKSLGFQDQISENPFPKERPRKDGIVFFKNNKYIIHLHVIEKNSEEHKKQVKYKEYMLSNSKAREEYEKTKLDILNQGITNQEVYGKGKSPFIKSILSKIDI
ncbi:GrpB family protein [Aliarcobacter lanthieri]|uniref:GrpB family protein n=1 Tax=Aliarcobacter lanthieri TaxID=1355374 RepID=UPI00047A253E|nr:GrpB family protein [Aliarcobacter lanthieri]